MLWDRVGADPDRRALALALIERVPLSGWRENTLAAASETALSHPNKWRQPFPKGSRDAIWYISEVSDASMKLPFLNSPATRMSTVIITRLDQNRHLKPFVQKVMLFDLLHPMQAFSRMQRTARAMFECLPPGDPRPSLRRIGGLNLIYTAIVFVWLFDRTDGDARTKRITRRSMRLIGLS
jgi:hypothetical protein